MSEKDGRCNRCGNQAALYPRTTQASAWSTISEWLCKHCIDLEATDPNRWTGRTTLSKGRRIPVTKPRSQPAPLRMHDNKAEKCLHCGVYCYPRYAWKGDELPFCGWAHAGLWLDTQVEFEEFKRQEDEGIAYVKRSLGITD